MTTFVLESEFTFEAPVHVRKPGGAIESFTGVFGVIAVTPETKDTDIAETLKSWRGIVRPDKSPLPVTPENRAELLSWPFVRHAVASTYLEEISRLPEKNSVTPAAPGPAGASASRNGAAIG